MASELESLLVRIDADTTLLRRALSLAEKGVGTFEANVDASARKAEKRLSSMGSSIERSLNGVAAAALAAFSFQGVNNAINQVTALNDAAESAGLAAVEYQRLQFAAGQSGVASNELAESLAKFAVMTGEARARTGSFYEFLQKSLPTVAAQITATKTQGEALEVVSNALARLNNAEAQAVLGKEAFGKSARDLTRFLSEGADATREATKSAEELGRVLDTETIKQYEAAQRELAKLSNTIDTTFKNALAGALPLIKGFNDALAESQALSAEQNINLGAFDLASTKQLEAAYTRLQAQLSAVYDEASAKAPDDSWFGQLKRDLFGTSASQADELIKKLAAVRTEIGLRGARANMAPLDGWEAKTTGPNPLTLQRPLPPWKTEIEFNAADALNDLRKKAAEGSGDKLGAIDVEIENETEKFRRMLAEKKIDEAEFQEARVLISMAAGDKIKAAYEEETKAAAALGMQARGILEGSVMGSLDEAFRTGKVSAAAFFADIAQGFAKMATQALILKPIMDSLFGTTGAGGSLSGALSGLLTPRATGGPMYPGQAYLAGERGPELIVPRSNMVARPGASLGGGGAVYNIDARGADISVAARVERALAQAEARRRDPVQAVAAHSRRYPARAA